ncbi:MAG: outer membrane lipoprotein-sorting protein [Candidatus Brocadiae bacterium]|nr:outer membrane lipoprotein-sorting protein [Candidatus Brocadiia bacterium]
MNSYRRVLPLAVLSVLSVLSALAVPALAGEPSVDEIVAKANQTAYYQADDGRANVHMTITDAQGRTRERKFTILRRDVKDGADQKFYVYFQEPADVRKMVYMVWKHVDKDDDRWLYLPALDLVKRIAATDKRTSFAGSHFLYEDVSGRSTEDDTHTLVETTAAHYVLKNVPKDPKSVEFSSFQIWIDKRTFMPMKAEYLGKDGKKSRVVEALEVKDIQGFPTVVKSRVQDLKSGGNTVSEFSSIKYNIQLPDDIFTERYLRRAPRRYLR